MVIVAPMEQECAGLMSLMAEAFQFHGARFRHVAHAFAGIDAGDDALTYAVNAIRGLRRLDRPAPTKRARRQGPVVEASPSAPVAAAMITGKVPIAAQNSLNEIRPEEFLKVALRGCPVDRILPGVFLCRQAIAAGPDYRKRRSRYPFQRSAAVCNVARERRNERLSPPAAAGAP
jgi:hypothetical protein